MKFTPEIFEDTETAFSLKSDAEIEKAYWLFNIIKNEPLVKIGSAVTKFALKHHIPIEGLIRTTVFEHFCGGVTEKDTLPLVKKLYSKGVYSILDFSVEGAESEEVFHKAFLKTKNLIEFASLRKEIPFAVFKPTGIGAFKIYEKVSSGEPLSEDEQKQWESIRERYYKLAQTGFENKVPIMVDAEESWMQKAVDDLLEELMLEFNKEFPYVITTMQFYRKDRLDYLKALHEKARSRNFKIGVKLVRGAYLEKERERAQEMGYESPVWDSKEQTDQAFNDALKYMIKHVEDMMIYAGTHNEESSLLLANLIEEKSLERNDPRVWFGQLLGMSDHITFNLAKYGFNTSKYIPFGPVKHVMPYLIRRAEENTSVTGQTTRELELLIKEKKRRNL